MLLRSLPLFVLALGSTALYSTLRSRGLPAPEAGPLAAATGLLTLASLSLVAARLGIFDPWAVGAAGGALLAGTAVMLRRDNRGEGKRSVRSTPAAPAPSGEVAALLATVVAFGLLYGLFPTYFLLGSQDPGLYVAFAVRIARSGGRFEARSREI